LAATWRAAQGTGAESALFHTGLALALPVGGSGRLGCRVGTVVGETNIVTERMLRGSRCDAMAFIEPPAPLLAGAGT